MTRYQFGAMAVFGELDRVNFVLIDNAFVKALFFVLINLMFYVRFN